MYRNGEGVNEAQSRLCEREFLALTDRVLLAVSAHEVNFPQLNAVPIEDSGDAAEKQRLVILGSNGLTHTTAVDVLKYITLVQPSSGQLSAGQSSCGQPSAGSAEMDPRDVLLVVLYSGLTRNCDVAVSFCADVCTASDHLRVFYIKACRFLLNQIEYMKGHVKTFFVQKFLALSVHASLGASTSSQAETPHSDSRSIQQDELTAFEQMLVTLLRLVVPGSASATSVQIADLILHLYNGTAGVRDGIYASPILCVLLSVNALTWAYGWRNQYIAFARSIIESAIFLRAVSTARSHITAACTKFLLVLKEQVDTAKEVPHLAALLARRIEEGRSPKNASRGTSDLNEEWLDRLLMPSEGQRYIDLICLQKKAHELGVDARAVDFVFEIPKDAPETSIALNQLSAFGFKHFQWLLASRLHTRVDFIAPTLIRYLRRLHAHFSPVASLEEGNENGFLETSAHPSTSETETTTELKEPDVRFMECLSPMPPLMSLCPLTRLSFDARVENLSLWLTSLGGAGYRFPVSQVLPQTDQLALLRSDVAAQFPPSFIATLQLTTVCVAEARVSLFSPLLYFPVPSHKDTLPVGNQTDLDVLVTKTITLLSADKLVCTAFLATTAIKPPTTARDVRLTIQGIRDARLCVTLLKRWLQTPLSSVRQIDAITTILFLFQHAMPAHINDNGRMESLLTALIAGSICQFFTDEVRMEWSDPCAQLRANWRCMSRTLDHDVADFFVERTIVGHLCHRLREHKHDGVLFRSMESLKDFGVRAVAGFLSSDKSMEELLCPAAPKIDMKLEALKQLAAQPDVRAPESSESESEEYVVEEPAALYAPACFADLTGQGDAEMENREQPPGRADVSDRWRQQCVEVHAQYIRVFAMSSGIVSPWRIGRVETSSRPPSRRGQHPSESEDVLARNPMEGRGLMERVVDLFLDEVSVAPGALRLLVSHLDDALTHAAGLMTGENRTGDWWTNTSEGSKHTDNEKRDSLTTAFYSAECTRGDWRTPFWLDFLSEVLRRSYADSVALIVGGLLCLRHRRFIRHCLLQAVTNSSPENPSRITVKGTPSKGAPGKGTPSKGTPSGGTPTGRATLEEDRCVDIPYWLRLLFSISPHVKLDVVDLIAELLRETSIEHHALCRSQYCLGAVMDETVSMLMDTGFDTSTKMDETFVFGCLLIFGTVKTLSSRTVCMQEFLATLQLMRGMQSLKTLQDQADSFDLSTPHGSYLHELVICTNFSSSASLPSPLPSPPSEPTAHTFTSVLMNIVDTDLMDTILLLS